MNDTQPIKVWTMMRNGPFTMGGDLRWEPYFTTVEGHGPHDLGKDQRGFVVTAPNGRTFIAESVTGAFVGESLEAVRKDIERATATEIANQIATAKEKIAGDTVTVSAEQFWAKLKCNRS